MAWPRSIRPKKAIKDLLRANLGEMDLNDPETRKIYQQALKEERSRIEDITKTEFIRTKPGMSSPFPKWDPTHPEQYSQPITVFDTETGHNNEIVALGAVKVAFNNITKKFETIDTYERYYMPTETRSKQWREALAVHGLTPELLNKLRRQQHASYGKHYDAQEEIAFRKFFEGSILSGHNIDKADIPWALGDYLPRTSTIDTLTAMENMRGRGGNKLDQVFKDVTGKTMEQAGFGHHNALADTYATAIVLEALLNQRNVTGQSLRYILEHKAQLHLVPKDTPDVFGESQLAQGPYKDYLKGVQSYLSMEKLGMRLPEGYGDLRDPSTGKLREGYYIEDLGASSVDRGMDFGSDTFLEAAKIMRSAIGGLQQSIRDISGEDKIRNLSARPAQVRFLSKLVGNGPVYENDAPQAWKDAAQVLGIPSTDLAKYYKSSYDYALLQGNATDVGLERQKGYAIADKAYNEGRITKGQLKTVIASQDIQQALDAAVESTDAWTAALKRFSDVPVFNPDRLFNAFEGGMQHALGQTKGILPSYMLSPLRRYGDLVTQNNRYNYAPFKAADNILNVAPITAGAIGFALGGPIGAGIGMGVAGAAKLGTQVWGNVKEAQINRQWNMTSMGLDVLGLSIDLITMPFKALARATNLLVRGFNLLSGSIGKMSQLGTPLTNLTGIGYAQYQGYEIAEGMIGLSKGSLNTASEDVARQAKLLYTTGQYNADRLRSASILGIFNEVYGPNASFESAVNTLARRGQVDASTMALVSQINPNMAQTLQVMSDLGVTELSALNKPKNVHFSALSDRKRKDMRIDAYEFNAIGMSFGNSFKRIGDLIWRGGGRSLVDTFNRALASIAESSSWKEAWGKIKDQFAGFGDSDIWKGFKEGLSGVWETVKPKLLSVVDTFVNAWIKGIGKILVSLADPLSEFLSYLRNFKLDYKIGQGFVIEQRWDPNTSKVGKSRFQGAYNGTRLGGIRPSTNETGREALASWKALRDAGTITGVFDTELNRELTWEEFEGMMRYGPDAYVNPTALRNTFSSLANTTSDVASKALGMTPEVLSALGESLGQMTQEVITTVRVELVDQNGKTKTIEGKGASAVLDKIKSTILRTESRRI